MLRFVILPPQTLLCLAFFWFYIEKHSDVLAQIFAQMACLLILHSNINKLIVSESIFNTTFYLIFVSPSLEADFRDAFFSCAMCLSLGL